MVLVEDQLATTTMTVQEMDQQIRNMLTGLTKVAETATQTATSCQALQASTEQLLKSQEVVSSKVNGLESQIEGFSTCLTSLEGTIAVAAQRTLGPNGHCEETAN